MRNERHQKRKEYSQESNTRSRLNTYIVFLSLLLTTFLFFSGCLENTFFSSRVTYESIPVKVLYELTYGYYINTTGDGQAIINYGEYIPFSKLGTIYFTAIQPETYKKEKQNENQFVFWNETLNQQTNQTFSISTHIIQESIINTDLSGKKSLPLQEIYSLYPDITNRYLHGLGNDSQNIIDPYHPEIFQCGQTIKQNVESENAFLIGKQVFSWLKNNTMYVKHELSQPQSAIDTYNTGMGDCDDLTYLYISLCKAAGIPSRYIRGFLVSDSSVVSHVWAEIFVGKNLTDTGWLSVECAGTGSYLSEIHQHYGIQDANHLRLCVDDGTNETFNLLINPIQVRYESSINVTIMHFEQVKNYTILSSKQLIIKDTDRYYD